MRTPLPAPPHRGGCLCGSVRFQLMEHPLAVNACHCMDCKKLSGVSHAIFLHVRPEHFVALGPTSSFIKTAKSGRQVEIVRCAVCGTRLYNRPVTNPNVLVVAAGVLDDPHWPIPTSHIWTKDASPGFVFEPDTLQVEGQPPDRQTLWDKFTAIYGS